MLYTGEILGIGETSSFINADRARANFGYEQDPVIVIGRNNKAAYIHTLDGANAELGANYTSLDDALAGLLAKYNGQQ